MLLLNVLKVKKCCFIFGFTINIFQKWRSRKVSWLVIGQSRNSFSLTANGWTWLYIKRVEEKEGKNEHLDVHSGTSVDLRRFTDVH